MVAVPYARAGNDLCAVRTLRAYLEAAGMHPCGVPTQSLWPTIDSP